MSFFVRKGYCLASILHSLDIGRRRSCCNGSAGSQRYINNASWSADHTSSPSRSRTWWMLAEEEDAEEILDLLEQFISQTPARRTEWVQYPWLVSLDEAIQQIENLLSIHLIYRSHSSAEWRQVGNQPESIVDIIVSPTNVHKRR